jgi:hypothetical protein
MTSAVNDGGTLKVETGDGVAVEGRVDVMKAGEELVEIVFPQPASSSAANMPCNGCLFTLSIVSKSL